MTDLVYFIISHGCEYPLAKLMDIQAPEKHPFGERVNLILNFIDCSKPCRGTNVDNTVPVTSYVSHVIGEYRDSESELIKIFSERCSIIQCMDDICCLNCRKIRILTEIKEKKIVQGWGPPLY